MSENPSVRSIVEDAIVQVHKALLSPEGFSLYSSSRGEWVRFAVNPETLEITEKKNEPTTKP